MDTQKQALIQLITTGLLTLLISYLIAYATIAISRKKGLYDRPNTRSLHTMPTPRLGGISFVIVITSLLIFRAAGKTFSDYPLIALTLFPVVLAVVGIMDDIHNLSSKFRFMIQAICATGLTLMLSPLELTSIANFFINFAILLAILWSINLFNFMDGIDGIAGAQSIFIFIGLAILLTINGHYQTADSSWLFACAVSGFLILNWSPAKIFMGDVGSTFLGIFIAGFSLLAVVEGQLSAWSILILSGVFLIDASFTLIVRLLTGQRWHEAHRSHAYQKIAMAKNSHIFVTQAVTIVNCAWLLPLAVLANTYKHLSPAICVIAYIPLLWTCIKYRAGLATNN